MLSSCTLTVSDYIQSTICKTSSVFCFVSSFLSALLQVPAGILERKNKKKASRLQPSIGYSPFCPERICFCCFSFVPRFRLLSALALALAPLQSRKQQVVPFISFLLSLLLSFCFVFPLRIAIPDVLRLLPSTAFHWTLWTLFLFYFPDSALSVLTVTNYDV